MRPRPASLGFLATCLTIVLAHPLAVFAKHDRREAETDYRPFSADLPEGSKCLGELKQLRPTQFAIGMEEVRLRFGHVLQMKPGKQERYLDYLPRNTTP